jgi:hypothetical protein
LDLTLFRLHRIASHRIASHRIASHRFASHRITSHLIVEHRRDCALDSLWSNNELRSATSEDPEEESKYQAGREATTTTMKTTLRVAVRGFDAILERTQVG